MEDLIIDLNKDRQHIILENNKKIFLLEKNLSD